MMTTIKHRIANTGTITPVETPCRCGGIGMLQEWGERDSRGNPKRFAVVFCQDCERKTKIYSERTFKESKQEALLEWNRMNTKQKEK